MGLSLRRALLLLIVCYLTTGSALATTYYIAASGSDANNGTSKTTPWLHAPGMNGCASNCAATTPKAGDQFIFRGGDTWHTSAGSPIGLPWVWTWSGSSDTNRIYIGVDKSWYGAASWTRPIFTEDNALSSSFISSCAHNDVGTTAVSIGASGSPVNYVTLDNFEFTGKCWTGAGFYGPSTLYHSGSYITISNNYFHGWTTSSTSDDNHYMILGAGAAGNNGTLISGNVIDGEDSSHDAANSSNCSKVANPGSPCNSGFAIYQDCNQLVGNVIRYVSNGCIASNIRVVSNNLVEYLWSTFDGATHPNVVEIVGGLTGIPTYTYNNVIRHTHMNIMFDYAVDTNQTAYYFNNVIYDVDNLYWASVPPVCWLVQGTSGATNLTAYWYNNTFTSSCVLRFFGSPAWNGPAHFQNNHLIGYSPQQLSSTYVVDTGASATILDDGNQVWQSTTTANQQGYIEGNNFAPTSSSDATVSSGANLTNFCNSLADSDSSAACKNGTGGVSYDIVNHVPVSPVFAPRPSSGAWDTGAYQYAGGGGAVAPPTALVDTVH